MAVHGHTQTGGWGWDTAAMPHYGCPWPQGNKGVRYSCCLLPQLSLATREQGSDIQLLSPSMDVLGHKGNTGVRYSYSLPLWLSLAIKGVRYSYSLPLWLSLATRKPGNEIQLLSPSMDVLGHKGNRGVRYSCSLLPCSLLPWLSLATRKQGSDIQLLSPTMAVFGHSETGY